MLIKLKIEHLDPCPRVLLDVFLNDFVDSTPLAHVLKAGRAVYKVVNRVVSKQRKNRQASPICT
jgi:hypothetical protein